VLALLRLLLLLLLLLLLQLLDDEQFACESARSRP
jgi:hypothetical protein